MKLMGGRRRKMRGGNFYGAAVDPQLGSAGLARPAVANSAADPVTGRLVAEPTLPKVGGRRRRTGKKATRKGKKSRRMTRRRRTMRGGAGVVNSAGVGYGYAGTGSAGLANATPYASRVGGAPMNADMVRKA